jgi:hypothetical protein
MFSPIADLLLARTPRSADVDLFGRFVGQWNVDGTDTAADGSQTYYVARWDFGYILGGRAIQDVLYCKDLEHGTTIRMPRGDGSWDVVWMSPLQRSVTHLHARQEGERIVVIGARGDWYLHWSFNDIKPNSFVWRAEHSIDGGVNFRVAEEMRMSRV